LLTHGSIKQAVVVARQNEAGETLLVAYFTATDRLGINASSLRAFLKQSLPEYMIPTAFVLLDSLPLAPTGKVDRRALPEPGKSRPDLDTPYVAPRTAEELQLAQIWAEVLSLEQVGIVDNFFDLGGHSLTATQVVSRVIRTFRLEVPLKALFESPTVEKMAAVISAHRAKKLGAEDLDLLLAELESLSDEEAQSSLDARDNS
jgi:acyl carrier protein